MTDETDQSSPESDAVRRLLAEARHDEPVPADVAARMDRVLADLAAAPTPGLDESPAAPDDAVTPLPLQRRRRAAALLAAAAAIVVGGVVFAQHLPDQGTGAETAAGSSASEGDRFAAGDSGGRSPSHPPTARSTQGQSAPAGAAKPMVRDGRIVVHRQSFPADALAGQALLAGAGVERLAVPEAPCPTPSGDEQVVAALYEQAPAALVYHLPDGSTQVVDLVVCGSDRPVRSVTLPAP